MSKKSHRPAPHVPAPTPRPEPTPVPPPAPWRTTSYETVKRLHAAGILACNTFGQPLVFEYAPEERPRIAAVLGEDALG